MTSIASDKVVQQVLAVLPLQAPGLTCDAIHNRIGMWSRISIKHALRQLREEGAVLREGPHHAPLFRRCLEA